MRVDAILDSFYVLSSLWSGLANPQFCRERSITASHAAYRVVSAREPVTSATVTAFVNVNVVPMDTERVLRKQTVLVDGGRIIALGPATQIKVPAGAVRIDGRNQYLIPGLGEMHEHNPGLNAQDRLFGYLANGVTTVREIDFADLSTKKQMAGIPGPHPRVYIGAHIRSMPKLDSLAARVAALKTTGYDFLQISLMAPAQIGPSQTLDSLVATARQLGLPVATHAHAASFEQILALGARGSNEHLTGYFDTLYRYMSGPQMAPDVIASEIRALAAATQRAGVWNSPTLNCLEERRPPAAVKVARQLVKALQDAGAGLLLSADADLGSRVSPSWVHGELGALVRAGLTPYQALLAGTRNVAQYFGLLDSSGTVAVGKRADLVLLRGNPLADIRYTREPAGVMVGGQWLDRAALDQRLLAPPTGPRPRPWVVMEVETSIHLTGGQDSTLRLHREKFKHLTDSLEGAKAPEYERMLRLLADELGAMRAILKPEQHTMFDPIARVWLRTQIRRGYRVTVSGIAPAP